MVLILEEGEPFVIDVELIRWGCDEGSSGTLAVAFRDLSAHQEDLIQDALLKAIETLNGPRSGVRGPAADEEPPEAARNLRRTR